MAVPGQQQGLAPARGEHEVAFATGERERLGDLLDGLRRLTQQKLGGGIGHHRASERRGEDVVGVLGDHGQPAPVLAPALGHAHEEARAFGFPHQQPRLVHYHQLPACPGGCGDAAPDGVEGQEHGRSARFLRKGAQGEDDQVAFGAGGCGAVEQARVRAGYVGRQPVGEAGRHRGALLGQHDVEQLQRGGRQRPRAGVAGDPGTPIGGQQGAVERRALGRVEVGAQQDGQEGVQEQHPPHQLVGARLPGRGHVEGVEAHPRGAEPDDRAPDGLGQGQVLVLRVDDGRVRAAAEEAQEFELGEVGLAGARAGQGDGVVVVLAEAVPEHRRPGGGVEAQQHALGCSRWG